MVFVAGNTKSSIMKKHYLVLIFTVIYFTTTAQPVVSFNSFITGLTAPVDIINAKDGTNRLFIVQQNGIVRTYSGGALLPAPFLDMSSLVLFSGERGLLSVAFHPQYAANRYLFAYYNNTAGDGELAQFRTLSADPNTVDLSSRKIMLTVPKPYDNHNGCKLNFGPDGNLYFATGDGGSGGDPQNHAQDLTSPLGKMMRINVDGFTTGPNYYTVPADNPFIATAGALPEIYALGLRNPWRWNFDRQTGDMWIADVGQGAWEEVNMVPAGTGSGLNYGWRCYEGTHDYDLSLCGATPATGKTYPFFEYPHNALGGYAVTGGLVYRGTEFPALQGYYICADYVNPNGWLIKKTGANTYSITEQTNFPAHISSFGDAEDGTLYAVSLDGSIFKVNVAGALAINLLHFTGIVANGQDQLNWQAVNDGSLAKFEIERSADGTAFSTIGTVYKNNTGADDYSFATGTLNTERYYRLKIISNTGSMQYSATIHLNGQANMVVVINNGPGQLQLQTSVALKKLWLINTAGQQVLQTENISSGTYTLQTGKLSPGIYYLQYILPGNTIQSKKVMVY